MCVQCTYILLSRLHVCTMYILLSRLHVCTMYILLSRLHVCIMYILLSRLHAVLSYMHVCTMYILCTYFYRSYYACVYNLTCITGPWLSLLMLVVGVVLIYSYVCGAVGCCWNPSGTKLIIRQLSLQLRMYIIMYTYYTSLSF